MNPYWTCAIAGCASAWVGIVAAFRGELSSAIVAFAVFVFALVALVAIAANDPDPL